MHVGDVIAKAANDPDFRRSLIEHPKLSIEKVLGVALPADLEIVVHEQTATTIHLILPPPGARGADR